MHTLTLLVMVAEDGTAADAKWDCWQTSEFASKQGNGWGRGKWGAANQWI